MKQLPKDLDMDAFIMTDKEERTSVQQLTRSDIERQIENAKASQRIETHLLLVDNYLRGEHFSEASQLIDQAKQSVAALRDDFEQKSKFAQEIGSREQRLAELSAKLVANADIDAIVAHLSRSDLRDVGEKIEMKLKDVEQQELKVTSQNKKLSDKLEVSEKTLSRKLNGLVVLFILLTVLLIGSFLGAYFLRDMLFVSNPTSVPSEVSREEFVNLQDTIESFIVGIPTIPPSPTAVDLTSFEARLNEIVAALTPSATPVTTLTITTEATPTPAVSLPDIVVSAQITPTIKNANEVGEFVLTNLEYWFDIPDLEISLASDNDFLFQPDEDETRYEVVNSKNDNLGALYVQVWQGTDLIYEYIYPFVEDAFSEDNPKQLQINWANTDFPLLSSGQYRLLFVTKRDLVPEPIAIIGEPRSFVIESPIEVEVYDPTNSDSAAITRLRTYPLWNCNEACAEEILATTVQVLGYATVSHQEEDGPLPYRLPSSDAFTPVISFTTQLTVTSDAGQVVLSPGSLISAGNINEYSQDGTLFVVSNEQARFFLVRIPGTRNYYWLGETDMLQFYDPTVRKDLLALPVFAVTEANE